MTRLRIQVEPVGSLPAGSEIGALQRDRHRNGRPLLSGCGSFRHGLARIEPERPGTWLRCRDADDAQRAAALARQALSSLDPLYRLLRSDRPAAEVTVAGADVRIDSILPRYAVGRVLNSARAVSPTAPRSPVLDTVEFVECAGPEAITAFERGDLHATAPTSYEIARDCSGDNRFRRYQPDVFLLLMIGMVPRAVRREVVLFQQVFRDRLTRCSKIGGQFVAAESVAGSTADDPAGQVVRPLELAYADYWPNAAIAGSICETLAELGFQADARAISLGDLRERTTAGDFDLALVLANGHAGQHLSIPLTLARAAALAQPGTPAGQPVRAALTEALLGPEDGPAWPAVTAAAQQLVPVVPLGRLLGGSLMQPGLPDHPLGYGCVLPLEHYAGGCCA